MQIDSVYTPHLLLTCMVTTGYWHPHTARVSTAPEAWTITIDSPGFSFLDSDHATFCNASTSLHDPYIPSKPVPPWKHLYIPRFSHQLKIIALPTFGPQFLYANPEKHLLKDFPHDAGLFFRTSDSLSPADQYQLILEKQRIHFSASVLLIITANSSVIADQNCIFLTQNITQKTWVDPLKFHKPIFHYLHCSQHSFFTTLQRKPTQL